MMNFELGDWELTHSGGPSAMEANAKAEGHIR
jgi:hypothetical protein